MNSLYRILSGSMYADDENTAPKESGHARRADQ